MKKFLVILGVVFIALTSCNPKKTVMEPGEVRQILELVSAELHELNYSAQGTMRYCYFDTPENTTVHQSLFSTAAKADKGSCIFFKNKLQIVIAYQADSNMPFIYCKGFNINGVSKSTAEASHLNNVYFSKLRTALKNGDMRVNLNGLYADLKITSAGCEIHILSFAY